MNKEQLLPLDVVWLKRDVRLDDHGPLAAVAPRNDRAVILLYCYEPDQLADTTVHGSHIRFINEGLLDLDQRLYQMMNSSNGGHEKVAGIRKTDELTFRVLTVCYNEIVATLTAIHEQFGPIKRLFAHQETGHLLSFERDKRVRRWCSTQQQPAKIPFIEFPQSGVTRCLNSRDDFSVKWNAFMDRQLHATPTHFRCKVVNDLSSLPGIKQTRKPLCDELDEIPKEHRDDRADRQYGGETKALATLETFLQNRGVLYSTGISSPNSSWNSCSRLSPYLAWGHISLRRLVQSTRKRQLQVKDDMKRGLVVDKRWLRSLSSFTSRLHWRSHFMQKLEMEPLLEKHDLSPAYRHLRRQPGDWNGDYYTAWTTGNTGFPLVDACMRCLIHTGWVNFRMRAMLVSFATYNLWLDWKRIAPHLARVFLDYEPGIHYPQLQMQAGTTGINAMRVYSVSKQAEDQDPEGFFIRKYVPELQNVPKHYIHEPWRMSISDQKKCGVGIGLNYPKPGVDEKESARVAKQKVAEIKSSGTAKRQAQEVYQKHGSRSGIRDSLPGVTTRVAAGAKKAKKDANQPSILDMLSKTTNKSRSPMRKSTVVNIHHDTVQSPTVAAAASASKNAARISSGSAASEVVNSSSQRTLSGIFGASKNSSGDGWNCHACTFLNLKSHSLACDVCATVRK